MFKLKTCVIGLLIASLFSACSTTPKNEMATTSNPASKNQITVGRITTEVNLKDYANLIYVDVAVETEGNGEISAPFKTINAAIESVVLVGEKNRVAVLIANGAYVETTIQMVEWVDLLGGFNSKDWSRDINKNETVLTGKNSSRILVGANNSTVDGFTFTKAIYRGKGAAIFCDNTSPLITNNTFLQNKTLGPLNWNPKFWHETANDGGAIYFTNGSNPVISNNVFAENSTDNGRGAAIACAVKCNPIISNNVFINNYAGLNDPMRSSDGGAVSIFNWCNAEVKNNYFLGNKALTENDAGALFIALWSSANVSKNVFANNEGGDDAGAIFVGGQEHRYDGPLDPIPSKEDFFISITDNVVIGNRNSSRNSGAMRFTMESRGEFKNNITAMNNGIYFQRSEVTVENNIMLDNFLFIETKKGLELGSITRNIILGNYDQQVEAEVHDNYIHEEGKSVPEFIDDGNELRVISSSLNPTRFRTEVLVACSPYETNQLAGRVVKYGDGWGIVKSNQGNTISLWGKISTSTRLSVFPTYTLKNK